MPRSGCGHVEKVVDNMVDVSGTRPPWPDVECPDFRRGPPSRSGDRIENHGELGLRGEPARSMRDEGTGVD